MCCVMRVVWLDNVSFFFWFEAEVYIEEQLAATLNFSAYME